ncbi:MAG: zinc-ribbon domain-containing protein [Nitrospinota bacterium]
MIPVLIGLMTAGALAAVVFPLLRRDGAREAEDAGFRLKELLEAKDTVYKTLKELDFDRLAGKLSEADFRQLETQYRERGIRILREIDELAGEKEGALDPDTALSDELEREILALRKAMQAKPEREEEAETPDAPARDALDAPPEPLFCRKCGVPISSTDNFCFSCGAPLRAGPQGGGA